MDIVVFANIFFYMSTIIYTDHLYNVNRLCKKLGLRKIDNLFYT